MRQVCLAAPAYPSSLGTLTRLPACLPACEAVFGGMGRETLYSTEAEELSMWKEGHTALGHVWKLLGHRHWRRRS